MRKEIKTYCNWFIYVNLVLKIISSNLSIVFNNPWRHVANKYRLIKL